MRWCIRKLYSPDSRCTTACSLVTAFPCQKAAFAGAVHLYKLSMCIKGQHRIRLCAVYGGRQKVLKTWHSTRADTTVDTAMKASYAVAAALFTDKSKTHRQLSSPFHDINNNMSGACLVVLLLCKDLSIARLLTNTTEVKPGLKTFQISKDVRQQEVEQTPQLTQVVLQRCACSTLITNVLGKAHICEEQPTENHAVIYLYMHVHTTCLRSKAMTADKLCSPCYIALSIPHI